MKGLTLYVGVILLGIVVITQVEGYAYFQERIPNGDKIPHPCKPNYLWHGVGHLNVAGGGERNSFGKDFARNGHKWDSCICKADSDGDGRTNGEELGDPDCEWSEGETPKITEYTEITHPGVCEPLDDPECQRHNDWEFCDYEEFTCDSFDAPGVKNITLRFPPTDVPAEETTYICMAFALPDDAEYHVIGNLGYIDNANVMHHIVSHACDRESGPGVLEFFNEPRPCAEYSEMISQQCTQNVGGWTVGVDGDCYGDEYGIRIGANGVNVVVLEFHWNNPEKRADYVDSSGLTIVYTEDLRPNDATGFNIGPLLMEIPPGVRSHTEIGYCSSDCTNQLIQHPIYIPGILPHMHYLGRSMVVEQWRNGVLYKEILNDQNYKYDSPIVYSYNPPIEVLPGDAFRVFCTFNSMNKDDYTYWGQGTFDEMCFAMMTVYPANATLSSCISFGADDNVACSNIDDYILASSPGCNYTNYFTGDYISHYLALAASCDSEGKECKPNCEAAIAQVTSSHPCFEGNSLNITKMVMSAAPSVHEFLRMMSSCKERPDDSNDGGDRNDDTRNKMRPLCPGDDNDTSHGSTLSVFFSLAVVLINMAFSLIL